MKKAIFRAVLTASLLACMSAANATVIELVDNADAGTESSIYGQSNIVFGNNSTIIDDPALRDTYGIVIGDESTTNQGITIGGGASSLPGGIKIGNRGSAGADSINLGNYTITDTFSVGIGQQVETGQGTLGVGDMVKGLGQNQVIIGSAASGGIDAQGAVVVGEGGQGNQNGSVVLGRGGRARFVPKRWKSLRARLGLSAADFGLLVGASGQSVYNWEAGKSIPRQSQQAALAVVRGLGKREAMKRLETMAR